MSGVTLDLATASMEVKTWLRDIANRRVHRDTGRIPWDVFQEERSTLRLLPLPYQGQVSKTVMPQGPIDLVKGAYPKVPPQHSLAQYDRFLEAA